VFAGDTVYLDGHGAAGPSSVARSVAEIRVRYLDTDLLPLTRALFARYPVFFLKDDHDWRFAAADPVFAEGRGAGPYRGRPGPYLGKQLFEEMRPLDRGLTPYRSYRWGRGVQLWLLEARECRYPDLRDVAGYGIDGLAPPRAGDRSPHLHYPDYCDVPGPDEMWGPKQLEWLTATLRASDADLAVVVSPTPLLGPDRAAEDSHVERFAPELARWLGELEGVGPGRLVLLSAGGGGLWHSRYRSRDGRISIEELGTGPVAPCEPAAGQPRLFRDGRGAAELVASRQGPGCLHVTVVPGDKGSRLEAEWLYLEEGILRRWKHDVTAETRPAAR